MSALHDARRDYQYDPVFRRVVDTIADWIERMHVTPAEARTAAMMASILVEERRPVSARDWNCQKGAIGSLTELNRGVDDGVKWNEWLEQLRVHGDLRRGRYPAGQKDSGK